MNLGSAIGAAAASLGAFTDAEEGIHLELRMALARHNPAVATLSASTVAWAYRILPNQASRILRHLASHGWIKPSATRRGARGAIVYEPGVQVISGGRYGGLGAADAGSVNLAEGTVDVPAYGGLTSTFRVRVNLFRRLPAVVVPPGSGFSAARARELGAALILRQWSTGPELPRMRIVVEVNHAAGVTETGIGEAGWVKLADETLKLIGRAASGGLSGLGGAALGAAYRIIGRTRGVRYRHVRQFTPAQRTEIAEAMGAAGLDGRGRFRSVGHGLNEVFSVLARFGIEPDQVLSHWLFAEPSGSRLIRLAWTNPDDSFSPTSVEEMGLSFSWHTEKQWGEARPVEIVAYLS